MSYSRSRLPIQNLAKAFFCNLKTIEVEFWFAEALDQRLEKERMQTPLAVKYKRQSLLSPHLSNSKKRRGNVGLLDYGLFRSINTITIPTIAIASIIPTTAGTKYTSDMFTTEISVGVGVGSTESTAKAATACDGQ